MSIGQAFNRFPKERAVIGHILVGYADLEISLMHCTHVVRSDLDAVLKAMFRARGETQRIDIADAFARQHYHKLGLGNEFATAIGTMRYCLKIRNQYSHCLWHDDNTGKLAFVNLEEIAKEHTLIEDLHGLTRLHVDVPLLLSQVAYFDYTDDVLAYVNFEGRFRDKKIPSQIRPWPGQLERPDLCIH